MLVPLIFALMPILPGTAGSKIGGDDIIYTPKGAVTWSVSTSIT